MYTISYIYCVFKDRRLALKLIFVFVGLVIGLFIGNYVVGFMIRDVTIFGTSDYLRKLWDYIGGSLINSNYSITENGRENYKWYDILYSSLIPIINMFTNKAIGIKIDHKSLPLGFREINQYGSTSNVMSLSFINLYTG